MGLATEVGPSWQCEVEDPFRPPLSKTRKVQAIIHKEKNIPAPKMSNILRIHFRDQHHFEWR